MTEFCKFVEEANRNYEEVNQRTIQLQEANQAISENEALKTNVLVMENKFKEIKTTCNKLEQYSRHECSALQGILLPQGTEKGDTNEIVIKLANSWTLKLMRTTYRLAIVSILVQGVKANGDYQPL